MKKFTLIITTTILMLSCEKHDKPCNCSNPLEELGWLRELQSSFTNCSCGRAIIQAKYNNETVFYATMNDPLCDGYYPVVLLNCNGETVRVYDPPLNETFANEVTDQKQLYYCKTALSENSH
jgi:hypothetical protein